MGRVVAYLGPATYIADAIEGGSYSLARQATACPDGFGIGWYPEPGGPPVRVRSRGPMSSEDHLLEVPRRYPSTCVIGHARALDGEPAELSGVQPLAAGPYLFVHEGKITGFESIFLRPLLASLSDEAFAALQGRSPAEVLFALWLDALEGEGPDAMANALESVVGRVQEIAAQADQPASFAWIITDGHCLIAVSTATHEPPAPLYTIVAEERAPVPATGRIIATEPTYPGAWETIDAHALMIFTVQEDAPAEEISATETPAPV